EQRRSRHVVVPDRVMHDLVVPLALAGLQIEADEAVAKQVVARTMASVEIRGRIFNREIHEAELFVDRDLRPHAGVAVGRPRVFFPRVVAEFTRAWDWVERPEELPGLRVPAADETLRVVGRLA